MKVPEKMAAMDERNWNFSGISDKLALEQNFAKDAGRRTGEIWYEG